MTKALLIGFAAIALVAPVIASRPIESGLKTGESVSPFHPKHMAGPLAGTDKCFPCTFKAAPQVQVWVNNDSTENVVNIAKRLQHEMDENKESGLKAMIVFVGMSKDCTACIAMAHKAIDKAGAKDVQFSIVGKNDEPIKAYKINLDKEIKNTVIAYKDWKVVTNVVNAVDDGTCDMEKQAKGEACSAICGAVKSILK